jgi:hypothetical protein
MITKTGELVAYIQAAVAQHGATPHTEVRVRVGKLGPVHRITALNGVADQRGFSLLLELDPIPESQD